LPLYTLSLHDALPISGVPQTQATLFAPQNRFHPAFRTGMHCWRAQVLLLRIPSSLIEYTVPGGSMISQRAKYALKALLALARVEDRKSTRLNSSHQII